MQADINRYRSRQEHINKYRPSDQGIIGMSLVFVLPDTGLCGEHVQSARGCREDAIARVVTLTFVDLRDRVLYDLARGWAGVGRLVGVENHWTSGACHL